MFERVHFSLIYEVWCVHVPFKKEDLEEFVTKINQRPTYLTPRSKLPKLSKEMKRGMKIDEYDYPYWDCEKGNGKRHYIMNV